MSGKPREDRESVAEATLTLRLTRADREGLERLVATRAAELADQGVVLTAAGYVRGLIRQAMRAEGIIPGDEPPAKKARARRTK